MSIIKVENLSKKFGEKVVLSNLNIKIEQGEMVAIVGKSGSGKSTLLNIIGLISEKSNGNFNIFDFKNIKITSKKAMFLRRKYIGYLFQNYALVDDETVKWNLNLALKYKKLSKKIKEEQIDKILEIFSLQDLKKKPIYKLSGGEQQRIAMARLMLQESQLILADEPTGSLDEENRDIIIRMLKKLNS